ncbi:hypothetical protein D3C76_1201830 [compost metagenome]
MLFGEVKHSIPNATLRLKDDLLTNILIHMDGIREYFLTIPATVYIRMVEEIGSFF